MQLHVIEPSWFVYQMTAKRKQKRIKPDSTLVSLQCQRTSIRLNIINLIRMFICIIKRFTYIYIFN